MRPRVTTNAGHLVAKYEKRVAELTPAVKGAINRRTRAVLKEVQKLSSRRYASTKQLRKMGHPYAKSRFSPRLRVKRQGLPAPAFVINKQSANGFATKWVTELVRAGGGWVGKVKNLADYSRFMRGTKKMIKRPILTEADRRVRGRYGRATAALSAAVHKALKQ